LTKKQSPYEHEQVEGFDKLENLEVCVDMEAIFQPTQTQQVEATLQQTQTQQVEATLQPSQTQQDSHKLIVKVPKMSVYNKRSSSKAMGTSDQHNSLKRMKISQSPQIVDLEEEEPKEQVNLDIVESGTSNVEVEKESKLQSEGNSRTFSNKKHIFDKTSGATYQSKEDLAKQYAENGNIALGEMRDLVHEVEKTSQYKSSLFTVRDVENMTFNIAVAYGDKVSKIKIRYDNISAPDKVKLHKNTSDMLYSDYLSLSLKNSKMPSYAMKLEGQLRQEKTYSKAWNTQVKRLEFEGPQGVKSSLDEKDKLIQSLKKKLKMSTTKHPQTTKLVALEHENETLRQEALDYKARELQLE
jgi:hypothetical protein